MEQLVAKVRKGHSNELWIVLTDFTGETRLDLREYFHPDSDVGFVPTKKGVSVAMSQVPALRDALDALAAATDVGTVATFAQTPRAQIRAGLRRFEGHTYAELRLFVLGKGSDGDWRPTPKGVTFNPSIIPAIAEAVGEAEELLEDSTGGTAPSQSA